jgi:hypothetical protein
MVKTISSQLGFDGALRTGKRPGGEAPRGEMI